MKNITIIPRAGLCNRLRVISSGINIAKILGINPLIYWNKEKGCNACFSDLFLPINKDFGTIIENKSLIYKIYYGNIMSNLFGSIRNKMFDQAICEFNQNEHGNIFDVISPNINSLLLQSCHSMYSHLKMNELFIPIPEISEQIDLLIGKYTPNTIGVHIRRTDHIKSIRNSSLNSFIDNLKREINLNPQTNFYLATDDPSIKDTMVNIFGDRIMTIHEEPSRNTIKGMKFAVVDLFCLSKTIKIIGSSASSYSEIAAELGNIELIISKDEK